MSSQLRLHVQTDHFLVLPRVWRLVVGLCEFVFRLFAETQDIKDPRQCSTANSILLDTVQRCDDDANQLE